MQHSKLFAWFALGLLAATLAAVRENAFSFAQTLAATPPSAKSCAPSLLLTYVDHRRHGQARNVPVWRMPSTSAFYFDSGMTIDADGAPNAYNPDNTGLDDLANAGEPGNWVGLALNGNGEPYVQRPNDPYPGYYVSCTALNDWEKDDSDPSKYVDASKIPYIVLPRDLARKTAVRLGDFAVVFNLRNGRSGFAIFGDVGTLGEGSVALAKQLGLDPDARAGGTGRGIRYLIFPGSGNGKKRALQEIGAATERIFQDWGGTEQMNPCATN